MPRYIIGKGVHAMPTQQPLAPECTKKQMRLHALQTIAVKNDQCAAPESPAVASSSGSCSGAAPSPTIPTVPSPTSRSASSTSSTVEDRRPEAPSVPAVAPAVSKSPSTSSCTLCSTVRRYYSFSSATEHRQATAAAEQQPPVGAPERATSHGGNSKKVKRAVAAVARCVVEAVGLMHLVTLLARRYGQPVAVLVLVANVLSV